MAERLSYSLGYALGEMLVLMLVLVLLSLLAWAIVSIWQLILRRRR